MNKLFLLIFVTFSNVVISQNTLELNAFSVKSKINSKWKPYETCDIDIVFKKDKDISTVVINGALIYTIIEDSKSEIKNEFGILFTYACYDQDLNNCIINIQSYDTLRTFDITVEYADLSLSYMCKNK